MNVKIMDHITLVTGAKSVDRSHYFLANNRSIEKDKKRSGSGFKRSVYACRMSCIMFVHITHLAGNMPCTVLGRVKKNKDKHSLAH